MNPATLHIRNSTYADYSALERGGIGQNTSRSWVKRGRVETKQVGGSTYINLSTIPKMRAGQISVLEEVETRQTRFNTLLNGVCKAYNNAAEYMGLYSVDGRLTVRALKFSRLHSVYFYLLNEVAPIREKYEAFRSCFPDTYTFNTFTSYCNRIQRLGFEAVLKDERGKRGRSIPEHLDTLIYDLYKNGKQHDKTFVYRKVREFCEKTGLKTPSIRWVRNTCTNFENYITKSRYGKTGSLNVLPFAKLEQAKNPNTQWQMDGFQIPLYSEGWKKQTLFAVMDTFSGSYIGFHIAESENTETILKALENAVNNTGYLPAEIVCDNHSFHKTQEAGMFRAKTESLGVRWTIDSNPRRKARLERSFKTFSHQYIKEYPGYLGQGIKSREKSGIPSPEYIDKYTRAGKWLTVDQIKTIICQCVHDYNHKDRMSSEKLLTPRMEEYKNNPIIHGIPVSLPTQIDLFIRSVKYKVRKGQINITRGGITYTYGLPKEDYLKYNGKEVFVKYADFNMIYVYNLHEDFIGTYKPMNASPAALADQKNGVPVGILSNGSILKSIRNAGERLKTNLHAIDPEAVHRMNPLTRDKDFMEEARLSGALQRAEDMGTNSHYLEDYRIFGNEESFEAAGALTIGNNPFRIEK